MTTTTENQTLIEIYVNRTDAEEVLYNTLGWGERPAFEIEMVAQGDDWLVLMGEAREVADWATERWAPLSKAKGWRPARALIASGRVMEY